MSRKARQPPSPPKPKPASSTPPSAGGPALIAARLLLALALGVSAYLAYVSLTHGTAIGCGPESDCDRVLGSRWARWFGVPVSVFAVMVDGLALWGTFQIGQGPQRSSRGWRAVLFGSTLILGAAAWFVALQAFAVGWCPYCMTAHASGVVAAVLLLAGAFRTGALPEGLGRRVVGLGAVTLSILIAGQFLHRPKTGRELKDFASGTNAPRLVQPLPPAATSSTAGVTPVPAATIGSSNAAAVTVAPPATTTQAVATATTLPPVTTNAAPPQVFTPGGEPVASMKRAFKFYEGAAALDLQDVPVMGSPTNPHAIISLFDYTCHHCRQMHPLLEEAQHAFSNQLVIASLPMPLDASCNRTMTRTPRAHTNACELARLGLIVWRASRERHQEFDQFMMTGPEPPPLAAAVGRAVQLVGTNALARAAMDPWVEQRLQFSLALYEAAYRRDQGRMPQLIVGRNVAVGTYPRDELWKLLTDNLDLKKPQ